MGKADEIKAVMYERAAVNNARVAQATISDAMDEIRDLGEELRKLENFSSRNFTKDRAEAMLREVVALAQLIEGAVYHLPAKLDADEEQAA
jgi:hypothetical protein